MSTPNDLIAQAMGTSAKNRPTTANVANELRLVLGRALLQHWTAGVTVNPEYFAKFATVPATTSPFANGSWARPADALQVLRLNRQANAAPVIVVPIEESGSYWAGVQRVARWAGGYVCVSATDGPVQPDALVIFYARQPVLPATLDAELDAGWPSAYNPLLVAELAIYLARKDGRTDELPALEAERDQWSALYLAYLRSETQNEQRIFHPDRRTETEKRPLAAGDET